VGPEPCSLYLSTDLFVDIRFTCFQEMPDYPGTDGELKRKGRKAKELPLTENQ
jgi:hypothetical protein